MNKLIIGTFATVIAGAASVATVFAIKRYRAKKELADIKDQIGMLNAMMDATTNGYDTFEWNGETRKIHELKF